MIKIRMEDIDNKTLLNDIISKKNGRDLDRCNKCGKQGGEECESCNNYDNKGLMEKVKTYVFERYDFYSKNSNNLNLITKNNTIIGHTKDLFHSSYDYSADFKKVREQIFTSMPAAIQAKCPFCMISAPNTLDHYFDKGDYPEFSVYTPNLIPCCSECNTQKGSKIFLKNGERKVLHYYYDKIPNYQFLVMTLELSDNIPVIKISLKLDESKEEDRIIKNHFAALKLEERYKKQFNDQLSTLINEFRDYYLEEKNINNIIEMINRRIDSYRKNNGINYWVACLFDGVVKNQDVFVTLLRVS